MKDETPQGLFKKYGVLRAIFVVLCAMLAAAFVGALAFRALFEFGVSGNIAASVGLVVGVGALNLLIALARRPAKGGMPSKQSSSS